MVIIFVKQHYTKQLKAVRCNDILCKLPFNHWLLRNLKRLFTSFVSKFANGWRLHNTNNYII